MPRALNGIKMCAGCKEPKDCTQFGKEARRTDGLCSYCKNCKREKLRPLMRDIMKERPRQNTLAARKHRYKKKFGISLEDYYNIASAQNNSCAICGVHRDSLNRDFALDHDHINNKIRGLLCTRCNFLLGYARDDITILQASIKYLEQYS